MKTAPMKTLASALLLSTAALALPTQALAQTTLNVRDADIRAFIAKWLPSFKKDNRSYLTVAVGCTGGQHRSVYMAERLGAYFSDTERVVVRHREQP